ncbi:MAG: acetylornithine deacetylase [Pseudomonadota bacterium]
MREAAIATLGDLIAFPTVSTESNVEITAYLADRLEAAGARVEIQRHESEPKANLYATLGPEGPGGVLLSGHTDVVPVADQDWTTDPFTMAERDGRLYGRGSCDMKGFVACAVSLAEALTSETLTTPLHFAFTHDEETGCLGAQRLADRLRERDALPSICIVGEPTEMKPVDGHKGCFEYRVRFQGLEGHGSAPDLGVNAVEYAARYVANLMELREALRRRAPANCPFDPPFATINIGRLSGGVAPNVVAGKAELLWEMRPVQPGDAEFVKDALEAYASEELIPAMRAIHPEAGLETEILGEVVGLAPQASNAARDLMAALTGDNAAGLVPFGTEAGLFQEIGMDVVVCGPGSIEQAHKADEFIAIAEIDRCLAMLERLGGHLTA